MTYDPPPSIVKEPTEKGCRKHTPMVFCKYSSSWSVMDLSWSGESSTNHHHHSKHHSSAIKPSYIMLRMG